ncbi:carboxypeptidase-like regulatory domain-containing protein [Labilibaculum sp. K2S]|uniref:carboxypeptidase-like regulatory domain-containing protein n=1 Tax=Labilibaculum sp. K2S TaxID=3056386 RepID=UPI0025A3209E|nr:carboxypeptidase-like regulatory domain-containing protein [Labilibaculum sp. K2S]MDM8161554.1 carboxypeptidase-like regulatory domain-containing protein [Labilibaculum sp. K2S]
MTYNFHPISTIEGIGTNLEQCFLNKGIRYTEDLITVPFRNLQQTFKDNSLIFNKLNEFKKCAIILQTTNDKQLTESFVKSGIQGLAELGWKKPERLVQIVEESKEKRLLKDSLDLLKAVEIQKYAIEFKNTTIFYGKVFNKSKEPVANAEVYINNKHFVTDDQGQFYIPGIQYGKRKIVIRAEGFKSVNITKEFTPDRTVTYTFTLLEGTNKVNKLIHTINPGDKFVTKKIEPSDLNAGDKFYVNYLYKNSSIGLLSVHQTKEDYIITTQKLVAPSTIIDDSSIQLKDSFEWTGKTFKKISGSLIKLRLLTPKIIN